MRHRSSPNSTPVVAPPLIHPGLRAAMSSLDIDLEEELARYRRNRRLTTEPLGRVKRTLSNAAIAPRHKPTSVPTPPVPAPPYPAEPVTPPTGPEPLDGIPPIAIAPQTPPINSKASEMAAESVSALVPLARQHDSSGSETAGSESFLESSEELLRSVGDERDLRAARGTNGLETVLTPLGIASMVLLLLSSLAFGFLLMNPGSLDRLAAYLSGRSNLPSPATSPLPSSPPAGVPAPNLANDEFVDLNLDTLSTLPSGAPAPTSGVPTSGVPTSGTVGAPSPAQPAPVAPASPSDAPRQTGADLSAAETIPLDPPSQRSETAREPVVDEPAPPPRRTVRRERRSEPSSRPERPSSEARSNREETAPAPRRSAPSPDRPQTRLRESQEVPANRPAPAPQPATAEGDVAARSPEASPSAAPQRTYQVVTEYSGDRSLEQAREAVGDAFVRNYDDGARVQMGAFSSEERARELVQQLEQQGIPAQVREP